MKIGCFGMHSAPGLENSTARRDRIRRARLISHRDQPPQGIIRGGRNQRFIWPEVDWSVPTAPLQPRASYSNAKMRFQSFFMLITVQPFFVASSKSAGVKAPTLVSGRPEAGP